jgi:predicted TIM-barrel fold metal-dependent hydrolase
MNTDELIAIDFHVHAEVSCCAPPDAFGEEYDRAADKYFGSDRRPTIAETVAHYRERRLGLVMFTVDAETHIGRRRIPNEEIAEAARANSDMMIAFASIDPHKGRMGAREARRLIEEQGVRGFKFHPTVQGFQPYERFAWPIYEVIAEHGLPAIFHTGHSGIGSGMHRSSWTRTSKSRTRSVPRALRSPSLIPSRSWLRRRACTRTSPRRLPARTQRRWSPTSRTSSSGRRTATWRLLPIKAPAVQSVHRLRGRAFMICWAMPAG